MRTRVQWVLLLMAGAGFLLAGAGEVQATPSQGANCSNCHAPQEGLMAVTNNTGTIDLGAGSLKFFDVVRGNIVPTPLSMNVIDGAPSYIVVLKGLDSGGVANNANKLTFTPDSTWRSRTVSSVPIFHKPNSGALAFSNPTSYDFNLLVNASTPLDYYKLVFAVATGTPDGPERYDDESFYVHVVDAPVPEPASWVMFSGLGVCLAWYWRRRKR